MSANQSSHQLSAFVLFHSQYVVYFQFKWKGEVTFFFGGYIKYRTPKICKQDNN